MSFIQLFISDLEKGSPIVSIRTKEGGKTGAVAGILHKTFRSCAIAAAFRPLLAEAAAGTAGTARAAPEKFPCTWKKIFMYMEKSFQVDGNKFPSTWKDVVLYMEAVLGLRQGKRGLRREFLSLRQGR